MQDEVSRIKTRIAKANRRINRADAKPASMQYVAAVEQKERLTARLLQLEGGS